MKSQIVENLPAGCERTGYSGLQVLRSAAGWYIGTTYTDPDTGITEPGSRDSDYYVTEGEAEKALRLLDTLGDATASTLLPRVPKSNFFDFSN